MPLGGMEDQYSGGIAQKKGRCDYCPATFYISML